MCINIELHPHYTVPNRGCAYSRTVIYFTSDTTSSIYQTLISTIIVIVMDDEETQIIIDGLAEDAMVVFGYKKHLRSAIRSGLIGSLQLFGYRPKVQTSISDALNASIDALAEGTVGSHGTINQRTGLTSSKNGISTMRRAQKA